jgi:hypothetical protein
MGGRLCNGRIAWARLYMDQVGEAGKSIDQAVQCLAEKPLDAEPSGGADDSWIIRPSSGVG